MTSRLPRVALVVLVVGLALHNLAMALLWQAGVRDTALDVAAAWKEIVLVVAFVAAVWAVGSVPQLVWATNIGWPASAPLDAVSTSLISGSRTPSR